MPTTVFSDLGNSFPASPFDVSPLSKNITACITCSSGMYIICSLCVVYRISSEFYTAFSYIHVYSILRTVFRMKATCFSNRITVLTCATDSERFDTDPDPPSHFHTYPDQVPDQVPAHDSQFLN